jgi:Bacterial CdiA-CT RNAse A domain
MDGREPIPECLPYSRSLAEILRAMRANPIRASAILQIIPKACVDAASCRDASKAAFLSGNRVFYEDFEYETIQLIENDYLDRLQMLQGYKRVAEKPTFAAIAGGTIDKHESTVSSSATPFEKLIGDRHTLTHIGRDKTGLESILAANTTYTLASSFSDKQTAEWAIALTIAFYQHLIVDWLASENVNDPWNHSRLSLPSDFDLGRPVGDVLTISEDESTSASRVKVVLVREATAPQGFYIKTAFPVKPLFIL